MQGKSSTPKTVDLPLIFWHIRASRDDKNRRSWMRRARLALADIDYLTDADRHEVMAVWSKREVTNVDSPALRKLHCITHCKNQPEPAREWEHIPAKSLTRASFLPDGSKKPRAKKPDAVSAWFSYGPAANDEILPVPVQLTSS